MTLKSATELAIAGNKPYPNDSAGYRRSRVALLADEIELRRHIKRGAAQRCALPSGDEARHYEFNDESGKPVKLRYLFGVYDTLVTYFWMHGPRARPAVPDVHELPRFADIPACDISQRVAIVVIRRSPVEG